jgi:phosphoinositide-3-kinase regulatory subunit 4
MVNITSCNSHAYCFFSAYRLLRKYSALLVHPSAEIRHGAIATVNAACNALGSPDSEVYVAHILNPYLRFKPSLRHLQTSDGLELCLYPSWSRAKFDVELSAFVQSKQQKSSGPWTSIGIAASSESKDRSGAAATTANVASRAASGDAASAEAKSGTTTTTAADVMEAQNARVREYLRMHGRHIKQPASIAPDANNDDQSASNVLKNGIEGSLKLAQNIKFPRQDTIGMSQRTLPLWYSTLRDKMQAINSGTSETSAIRSVSALGQIYGLSIMAASDGTTEQIGASGDELKLSDEEIKELARSEESKVIEAVCSGEWGSETHLDPVLLDTSLLITKLKALNVPPLPPRLGELNPPGAGMMQAPQHHYPASARGGHSKDTTSGSGEWRPKADTLLATSSPVTGHTAPVVRIAVSLDQSFFVSGSYDGSCRVWEMSQIESSSGVLDSSITYTGHSNSNAYGQTTARINDLAMVEGSHSVVSAASNGTVHVWRVDLVSQSKQSTHQQQSQNELMRSGHLRTRVVGNTGIRDIDPGEGEVLAVSHFNSPSASIVTFATQKGLVHSWDLRSCVEPFVLKHGPDIGYLTSMALGTDRNWVLTGTSRGFLALWDLRFNQTVKLWHHSRGAPITRLATSNVPPPQLWGGKNNLNPNAYRPFAFASCGPNECAMFDITTGDCRECFRTVGYGSHSSHAYAEDIPALEELPISAASSRRQTLMTSGFSSKHRHAMAPSPVTSINAMCGSIGVSDQSYLITGGGDARIRFWDFAVPSKCYVVSGQLASQPRPSYERIDLDGPCRLMLCRQAPSPSFRTPGGRIRQKKLGQGMSKPENHHTDAIQDLKIVHNALISGSRDCTVKVWR